MVEYGNETGTAMARTVGIPCGLAAQLILDGLFSSFVRPLLVDALLTPLSPLLSFCFVSVLVDTGKITKRGVFAPLEPEIFFPLIELLDEEGLGCKEEIVIE